MLKYPKILTLQWHGHKYMWLGGRLDVYAYAWMANLRLMWRVCATLDLDPTCAFIQVALSAGKKQLICSLIHIYQELIWERERCYKASLIQPPDRKADGWHALSLIRKTQGLYLVHAGSTCLTHRASKVLELNHLEERKHSLSVCLHFYMSLISIVAGLLQTRKVCELRERYVYVFHIYSHDYSFLSEAQLMYSSFLRKKNSAHRRYSTYRDVRSPFFLCDWFLPQTFYLNTDTIDDKLH